MTELLIKNVRLFDPGAGIDAVDRTIAVDGDTITSLHATASAGADRVIDGHGLLCTPGLVDLRAHLGEPGHTRAETVGTAVRAAAKGGFTTVCAMPTTTPPTDRVELVELITARARAAGTTRVLPIGAFSVERAGERLSQMAQLVEAGCVAFSDGDRAVRDSQLLRYGLELAKELGVTVISHAEDELLSLGGVMHEGVVSTRLGLRGVPGTAEVVGVSRDLALAALTGARLHIGHVSTAAAVDLIRQAKKNGVPVTAEVSPLHLRLTDEAVIGYNTSAKVFPPLRPASDVEGVIAGLADGTIDAVASDHWPRTRLEKNLELDTAKPGAITLESTLGVVLSLVMAKRLTLQRAIATLTWGPATVLGRPALGRLSEGGPADLVLIDPDCEWLFTDMDIASRSANTPLLGMPLHGRVHTTIAAGRITFSTQEVSDVE